MALKKNIFFTIVISSLITSASAFCTIFKPKRTGEKAKLHSVVKNDTDPTKNQNNGLKQCQQKDSSKGNAPPGHMTFEINLQY